MSYSQKKGFKSNFSHGKALEADRWDHGGFDSLNNEEIYINNKEDRSMKQSKQNLDKDYAYPSDRQAYSKISLQNEGPNGKWVHDKYDELMNSPTSQKGSSFTFDQHQSKKKRPDRALYSVRGKQGKPSESINKQTLPQKEIENTPSSKYAKTSFQKDEKDTAYLEDDNKSYTSNVSTAFSERLKTSDDDLLAMRDSVYNEKPAERQSYGKKDDSHLLFEILVDNDSFSDTIKVYDNEEDYESFLENLCVSNGIKDEVALHFKIYILYLIKNSNHPDFSRIEPLYHKLLEINYDLMMMNDVSKCNFDDSLLDLADLDSSQIACEKFVNDH